MKTYLLSFTLAAQLAAAAQPGDWLQFRGPNGSGIVAETNLPTRLAVSDIAWKTTLPGRGLASPIIVGERVFVTSASGPDQDRLHVMCFSARDGAKLWERQFWATGRTMAHPKTSVAAGTPCSDGERLYCLFSSNDLVCLDLDGNLLWLRGLTRDYPNASNSLGMAASPIVVGGTLIAQIENDSESFAVGLNATDGINRWKIDRPKIANWTSPVVVPDPTSGKPGIVLQSGPGLSVVDPADGKELWYFSGGASTIPSSTFANGVLLIPSKGITALKPAAKGEQPETLWQNSQLNPATGSPVVLGQRVFTVNGAGILTCGDLADGTRLWQLRLTGPFSATPVGGGTTLYLVNEKGLLQVVNTAAPEGEITSTLDLGEAIIGTPSLSNRSIFVRSDGHLWKLTGQ